MNIAIDDFNFYYRIRTFSLICQKNLDPDPQLCIDTLLYGSYSAPEIHDSLSDEINIIPYTTRSLIFSCGLTLVLDSEIYAHVRRNLCHLTCLKHLMR